MVNAYLGREDAPIGAETWKLIDDVAVQAAKSQLAGRRLLAVEGPYGFGLKAIPLGRGFVFSLRAFNDSEHLPRELRTQ